MIVFLPSITPEKNVHMELTASVGSICSYITFVIGIKPSSVVVLGVYIPSDRCGKQFIVVHIDSTNKYEESWEYNNIQAIPVYVVCDNGERLHQYH